MDDYEDNDPLTEMIIGCAYAVLNTLGTGFLEKVHENALAHELRKAGLEVKQQFPVNVFYDNEKVGDYYCDLLVNGLVILELKTTKAIDESHVAQSLNYLKATRLKKCLILNFGTPRLGIKRVKL